MGLTGIIIMTGMLEKDIIITIMGILVMELITGEEEELMGGGIKLKLKTVLIPQKGTWDEKYGVWRQTDAEKKRKDISPSKLYLVKYSNTWLLGTFGMQWYGWNFEPNIGSMSMQIEHLQEIHEFILDYMKDEDDGN